MFVRGRVVVWIYCISFSFVFFVFLEGFSVFVFFFLLFCFCLFLPSLFKLLPEDNTIHYTKHKHT